MKVLVTKEFQTPLRQFIVGETRDSSEVDGPVPLDHYLNRGFLSAVVDDTANAGADDGITGK